MSKLTKPTSDAPMSFAAALSEAFAPPEPKCSVHRVLKEMDPEQADEFRKALALPLNVLPTTKLRNACRKAGIEVGLDALGRHRRHACACAA